MAKRHASLCKTQVSHSELTLSSDKPENPMDELLRARLRVPEGADFRLKALRMAMSTVDMLNRIVTGQAFFALRETEQVDPNKAPQEVSVA